MKVAKVAGVSFGQLSGSQKKAVKDFLKWLHGLPGLQEKKLKFLLEVGRRGRRRVYDYEAVCGHRVRMDQEVVTEKVGKGARFALYPVCYRCALEAVKYVSRFPNAPKPSAKCRWSGEPLFLDEKEWFANLAAVIRALIFKWVTLDRLQFRQALDLYDNFVRSSEVEKRRSSYFQEVANIQANIRNPKEAERQIQKLRRKSAKELKTLAEKAGIPETKIDQVIDRLIPMANTGGGERR